MGMVERELGVSVGCVRGFRRGGGRREVRGCSLPAGARPTVDFQLPDVGGLGWGGGPGSKAAVSRSSGGPRNTERRRRRNGMEERGQEWERK